MNNSEILFVTSFEDIAQELSKINSNKLFVVVDETIDELFELSSLLPQKDNVVYKVKAGEDLKTIEEYSKCINFFLESGATRNDHIVAIGGGSVSDFAGFVAATILRGISWSIIPTTLLSIVDAAIGGKVAINSRLGKNLIGSFHFPERVLINLDFIETLPKNQFQSGFGEVLKYGLLDTYIFNLINRKAPLKDIVKACIDYKKKVVSLDAMENGLRRLLNLGHTFGHCFELLFKVPHGIAVILGMEFILRLENSKGLDKFLDVCKLHDLPLLKDFKDQKVGIDEIFKLLEKDKKKIDNSKINLVTIRDIGSHVISEVALEDLKNKSSQLWTNI